MENSLWSQFDQMNAIFRVREEEIPHQTRGKLLYIASRINKQPFNSSQFYDQQSAQAREIAHLDCKSLVIIFTTLVRTLLVQKKSLERQCKIKFNGFLEGWKEAKAFVNTKQLTLSTERLVIKYKLEKLSIGNIRKSKKTFDLFQKQKLAVSIKFMGTQIFQQFYRHLESKIEDGKQGKKFPVVIESIQTLPQKNPNEIVLKNVSSREEGQLYKSIRDSKDKSYIDNEEMSNIEKMVQKQFREGYSIVDQSQNMCMFISKTQPRIHINLFVKSTLDLCSITNYYLHQQQWCPSIISENIVQLEQNIFEIFRIFKKEGFFELERGTLTKVTVFCSKNTAQITEETINNGKKDNKLICSVDSTVKLYRCYNGIRIFVDCSFDGKNFYTIQDSSQFLIKWFKQARYFENNFKLSDMQKNLPMLVHQRKKLLLKSEKEPFLKNYQQAPSDNLLPIKKCQQADNMGTADTLENCIPKDVELDMESLFFKLKPIKPTCIPALDYIRLVINNLHTRYYLRSKFDQSIAKTYDNYIPSYILSELLKKKEFKVNQNKELVFNNREVIQSQKQSLMFVIKQVGANLISGKSVLNVSLPVDIFQPRTLLQRSASSFGLVPDYLIPVADADPLTQIKNITTLFANIPTLELVMLKPFNPILGQTFQAYIKGIPIYYEQISHHPPISSFYMTCPQFTMYGNLVAFADLSLNSAVGGNQGITYIKMRNGSQFQCYFPPCQVSGLIFGDRSFRAYGKGFVLEKRSNLLAQISIQEAKKGLYDKGSEKLYPGSILGGIFQIKPQVMENISKQKSLRKFDGLKSKDVVSKLCEIKGTWFEQIRINSELMNSNKHVYPLEYPKIALPSDSNYRLDVLYHKIRDIEQSQVEKKVLEQIQRADRRLREKGAKPARKGN